MVNASVHTVEAVRAAMRHDDDEVMRIVMSYLEQRGGDATQATDVVQAAGELLRDCYGFSAALVLSVSHNIPELAEQVLDVYALGAMEEA